MFVDPLCSQFVPPPAWCLLSVKSFVHEEKCKQRRRMLQKRGMGNGK